MPRPPPVGRGAAALGAMLALAGCASADPALYTIKPVPGEPQPSAYKVVVLRDVGLARYLDRLPIVSSADDYRLTVSKNDWWGEPLVPMLTRVLVDELSQRLPGSTVSSETSVAASSPDATAEVEIRRMDGGGSGSVVIRARIAVAPAQGAPASRLVDAIEPLPTPDARGFAAASSAGVGKVADALAAMLAR